MKYSLKAMVMLDAKQGHRSSIGYSIQWQATNDE